MVAGRLEGFGEGAPVLLHSQTGNHQQAVRQQVQSPVLPVSLMYWQAMRTTKT
jgi:hypothetical protein